MSNFEKVREFMLAMGQHVPETPAGTMSFDLARLRERVMEEEYNEVLEVLYSVDKTRLAKELGDLLYVVYGTAVSAGIPMDQVFEEVHKSNMSKLGDDGKPVLREDGKILKGPNYRPPDIGRILRGG